MGKLFVSYERKVILSYYILVRSEISLVNLLKCFLANRDNFFPYEQALTGCLLARESTIILIILQHY